jgi:hypothetical protein
VNTTVLSSCTAVGLRQEVAMPCVPTPPIHLIQLRDADSSVIIPTLFDPPFDPPDFAALYHADKNRAIALIAAITEPQRVRQALAYAAWLAYHGLEIDLATVLADWEAL